jgi:hypothetical protein
MCHAVPYREEKTIKITKAAILRMAPIPCVIELATSSFREKMCVFAIAFKTPLLTLLQFLH